MKGVITHTFENPFIAYRYFAKKILEEK